MNFFIELTKIIFVFFLFIGLPLIFTFVFREPLIIALTSLGIAILQIVFEE
ncbi:hypothetical protein SDC9_136484 [bioreactor metagenome]|uniref:Uncharacterized protein n=1 Tax=bioreactor metagenome TaxID=1076179 RepID=A0A645DJE7_9ZZZZ|nr:hypothetical protein K2F_04480 [Enterococcus thailandicus]